MSQRVMHLEMTPEMAALLQDLSGRRGTSVAETLRTGVALLAAATDAQANGLSVGAVRPGREAVLDEVYRLR